MRLFFLAISLLCVTACDQLQDGMSFDPVKALDSMEGPKVSTVEDAMLATGKALEAKGDFKQAAIYYEQAALKNPESVEIAFIFTDSLRRAGEFERVVPMYDDILKADPSYLPAKEGKALALMARGDYDTPITLLQEVLTVDNKRWKTLNALGILFTTRGMYTEALQYFDAASAHSVDNPSIINNRALSKALDRRYHLALEDLQKAATLVPLDSALRKQIEMNKALVFAADGKLPEAKLIAEKHLSGPALSNNLGLYAQLAKDNQLARTYLNMALIESRDFYKKAWDNLQTLEETAQTPVESADTQTTKSLSLPPGRSSSKKQ